MIILPAAFATLYVLSGSKLEEVKAFFALTSILEGYEDSCNMSL